MGENWEPRLVSTRGLSPVELAPEEKPMSTYRRVPNPERDRVGEGRKSHFSDGKNEAHRGARTCGRLQQLKALTCLLRGSGVQRMLTAQRGMGGRVGQSPQRWGGFRLAVRGAPLPSPDFPIHSSLEG